MQSAHSSTRFEGLHIQCFGDDAEPGSLARLGQKLEALLAEALKGVGRRARLVSAASQQLRARGFDGACGFEDLLAAFDRAGTAAEHQFVPAHFDAADPDDGVFGLDVAAHELIRFRNANGFGDAGQVFEFGWIDRAGIAGNADGGSLRARNDVRAETERFDLAAHAHNIGGRSLRGHDDEHVAPIIRE